MIGLNSIVNGILLGGLYGLSAMGFSLIFGIMRVPFLAHGTFVILASYLCYWLFVFLGMDPLISLLVIIPVFSIFGLVLHRFSVAYSKSVNTMIIACFGLSTFLDNLFLVMWRPTIRGIIVSYSTSYFQVFDIYIPHIYLIGFVVAAAALLLLQLFLTKTYIGKAIRATSEKPDIVEIFGVNSSRIIRITWILSLAMTSVVGPFVAIIFTFSPTSGTTYLLKSLVPIVLGGLGNTFATFVGGIILGFAETIGASFLGAGLRNVVAAAIFLVIVTFKPKGLFGRYEV